VIVARGRREAAAVHVLPLLAGLAVAAAGILLIWAHAESPGVGWSVLLLGVAAVAAALARR